LSGNNAAIVWSDADASSAATQVAWGAFAFAGQRCTANRRVIVPAVRVEKMFDELKAVAERLPWGDPLEPMTEIGPVLDEAKRDEIHALTAHAESSGFRVARLQSKLAEESWRKAGAYATPALIVCDDPDSVLVQEETMGPLLVVQPAEDFDHALALCNGVARLSAALFSDRPGCGKIFELKRAGVLKPERRNRRRGSCAVRRLESVRPLARRNTGRRPALSTRALAAYETIGLRVG
jgi:acyl-CoA reductase-like NAD-dependent aldehyde dehydrogenase